MTQAVTSGLIPRDARPREKVVIFAIAEYSFAISASAVQEIRSVDGLGGNVIELVRPVLGKVRQIVERDSRFYYVVSGHVHFHLPAARPTSVLILRNVPVAVLVGRIEEMAEMRVLLGLPRSFCGEERAWYRGLTVLGRRVLPVVEPRGFLTAEEQRQLDEESPGLVEASSHLLGISRPEKECV